MILHIFQYQIDKNTRLDTQNVSRTQKNRSRVVKTLRIVWCFTLVFAVVFLALGINSLVTMGTFSENEAATLLPFGAAIAFTVIGAISAVATFFLTFLGFVVPGMSKIAPKVSGYMIDANKENIQNVFRTVKDTTAPHARSRRRNHVLSQLRTKDRQRLRILQALRRKTITHTSSKHKIRLPRLFWHSHCMPHSPSKQPIITQTSHHPHRQLGGVIFIGTYPNSLKTGKIQPCKIYK